MLLISTDPASNLQDVFSIALANKGTQISDVPKLVVANQDPIQTAPEYRESVTFNEFSSFITAGKVQQEYDHIIFDTAPTGHTLRMLQLPSAWSNFISESTHSASCLGQLSGPESKKEIYKQAGETLANGDLTILILVTRPESAPFKEAARASGELSSLGVHNQCWLSMVY
ncbi:ArsA-related P-loop ATPase [Lacrimispora sp. BS-2]|uniref:ArsA-related P-loop ATPase n=1 Tax=Lacrimispora sp. BS-2 TaxID=3151850 RepID=A0AAU7PU23_9FIRM